MIPPTIRKRLTIPTCSSNCNPIVSRTQPGRLHPDVGSPHIYPTHGPKQELQNGKNPKPTGTYESAAKELGEKKTVLLTRTIALGVRCQSESLCSISLDAISKHGGRRTLGAWEVGEPWERARPALGTALGARAPQKHPASARPPEPAARSILPALPCPRQGSRAHSWRASSKKLLVGYGRQNSYKPLHNGLAMPAFNSYKPLPNPPPSLIHRVRHP